MDLNYLLSWIIGVSAASSFWRGLRHRTTDSGQLALYSLVVLVFLGSGFLWWPDKAGILAAALWVGAILAPALVYRRIDSLVERQEYHRAYGLSKALLLLRPGESSAALVDLLSALDHVSKGDFAEAERLMAGYAGNETSLGRSARAHLFAMSGRWAELRSWIERDLVPRGSLERDPTLVPTYLRSLGECGDRASLLDAYNRYHPRLTAPNHAALLDLAHLVLFSFGGRPSALEKLFARRLHTISEPLRAFWIGTALMASGKHDSARSVLVAAIDRADPSLARAIRRRLDEPLSAAPATGGRILADAEGELDHPTLAGPVALGKPRWPVTMGLICLNVVVFAIELYLGVTENGLALYRLGALLPRSVLVEGEWWRCVTATVLHVNFMHLFMNMVGLYILGPFVEAALGPVKYALCYAIAGVGSMAMIVLLTASGYIPSSLTLGASGAIMGMIGASAAVLVRDWYAHRSRLSIENLKAVFFNIAIQIVFDISTPEVSMSAHMGGMIIGLFAGALLYSQRRRRSG